jgi:hypothetical protein
VAPKPARNLPALKLLAFDHANPVATPRIQPAPAFTPDKNAIATTKSHYIDELCRLRIKAKRK